MALVHRRRRIGLGDTANGKDWPPEWIHHLPAGHTAVTEPNGDISLYIDGQWDSSIPHPGSGSYSDVVTDSRDPFYGKTEGDRASYFAAAGYDVAPTAGSMGTVDASGKFSMSADDRAAVVASNNVALQNHAATDPLIQSMLTDLHTGIHQGVNDPATLAANAKLRAENVAREKAYTDAYNAWVARTGGRGVFPGVDAGPSGPVTVFGTQLDEIADTDPFSGLHPSDGPGTDLVPMTGGYDPGKLPTPPVSDFFSRTAKEIGIGVAVTAAVAYLTRRKGRRR